MKIVILLTLIFYSFAQNNIDNLIPGVDPTAMGNRDYSNIDRESSLGNQIDPSQGMYQDLLRRQGLGQQGLQDFSQQVPQGYPQQNLQGFGQQVPQGYPQQGLQDFSQQVPQGYPQQNLQGFGQQVPQGLGTQGYAQRNFQGLGMQGLDRQRLQGRQGQLLGLRQGSTDLERLQQQGLVLVRCLHGVDTEDVRFFLNGRPLEICNGLSYGRAGDYVPIPAGNAKLTVTTQNNDAPLVDRMVSFRQDPDVLGYTIAVVGDTVDPLLQIIPDPRVKSTDRAAIRAINFNSNITDVEVALRPRDVRLRNINYMRVSSPEMVDVGVYDIDILDTQERSVVARQNSFQMKRKTLYTIYIFNVPETIDCKPQSQGEGQIASEGQQPEPRCPTEALVIIDVVKVNERKQDRIHNMNSQQNPLQNNPQDLLQNYPQGLDQQVTQGYPQNLDQIYARNSRQNMLNFQNNPQGLGQQVPQGYPQNFDQSSRFPRQNNFGGQIDQNIPNRRQQDRNCSPCLNQQNVPQNIYQSNPSLMINQGVGSQGSEGYYPSDLDDSRISNRQPQTTLRIGDAEMENESVPGIGSTNMMPGNIVQPT